VLAIELYLAGANPMFDALNGTAAEFALLNLVNQHRQLSPLRFPIERLLEIARSSPLGRQRLEAARPFFEAEYGIPLRNGGLHLLWESVPSNALLGSEALLQADRVYGIDVAFNCRGWYYAIDVTVNKRALGEKYAKLGKLRPLLRELNFDRVGVCLLRSSSIEPRKFLSSLPKHEHFHFVL
jgi:hypothetical protein